MRPALWTVFGFLLSCGGTSAPDLAAWNAEVEALRDRVGEYRAHAAATAAPASCARELDRYRADVEPRLERMRTMSGGMDDCMNAMGHPDEADFAKVCADMDAELRRHASEGCHSAEPAMNQAETEAHCDRMLEAVELTAGRAQVMMGPGMMSDAMCR